MGSCEDNYDQTKLPEKTVLVKERNKKERKKEVKKK